MIEKFTPLITLVFGALWALLKINVLERGKLKKIQNLKTAHSLFDKFETDFEKQFFENEWKEACFFMRSGIETNYKSIPKYIRLKDKLGLNYNWTHIKQVLLYLDLSNEDIKINLNWYDRILWKFAVLFFLLGLISTPFSFSFIDQFIAQGLLVYLTMTFLCIIPAIIGYLFVANTYSILMAQRMEKRLNSINDNDNNTK